MISLRRLCKNGMIFDKTWYPKHTKKTNSCERVGLSCELLMARIGRRFSGLIRLSQRIVGPVRCLVHRFMRFGCKLL